jgi:hypothetical protein
MVCLEVFIVRNWHRSNLAAKPDESRRKIQPVVKSCSGTVPWSRVGHSILISTCAPTSNSHSDIGRLETTHMPSLLMLIARPSLARNAVGERERKRTFWSRG